MNDYSSITKLIRELDKETQIKLSGFLDGVLVASESHLPTAVMAAGLMPVPKIPKVVVGYASQSGNAQNVAEKMGSMLKQACIVEMIDVADLRIKKIANFEYFFLVASTHGEGDPPDTAIEFTQQLNSKKAPKLEGVSYAVVALGDSSYELFCEFGKQLDLRLSELGATSIMERLECDVDFESAVEEWSQELLTILQSRANESEPTEAVAGGALSSLGKAGQAAANNPHASEIIQTVNLCSDSIEKAVYHVELEAPESRLAYEPGDSLGISVSNSDELIDALLNKLNLTGTERIYFGKTTTTLRDCLTDDAELYRLTSRQLRSLTDVLPNAKLSSCLEEKDTLSTFINTHDWLSVLESYNEISVEAQAFVNLLNPQVKRLYSISSSPLAHTEEIHLTIRLREFGENQRKGLVSGRVAQLSEGSLVNVYIKPNKNFRLPNDKSPIIMICAGTGIAPFRSFLYHLQEQASSNEAWLFFGEQYFRDSFLYQSDLLKLLDNGVLTHLTTAFSREAEKQYVQDKLRACGQKVFEWIQQGAYIYVCGSADTMAPAVHEVLQDIISQNGGVEPDQAQQKLQEMLTSGHYKRDVY